MRLAAFVVLVLGEITAVAGQWERIGRIGPVETVTVQAKTTGDMQGRIERWSPQDVTIRSSQGKIAHFGREDVVALSTIRRPSRGKRVLMGALIGFAAGFPAGWLTTGYVGDTNNPRIGMRMENVARFGGFGAGVGAAIGALLPAREKVAIVYKSTPTSK